MPRPRPKAPSSIATISVSDLSSPSPEYSRRATATVPVAPAAKPATNVGAHPNPFLNGTPDSLASRYDEPDGHEPRPLISPVSRDSFSS